MRKTNETARAQAVAAAAKANRQIDERLARLAAARPNLDATKSGWAAVGSLNYLVDLLDQALLAAGQDEDLINEERRQDGRSPL